MIQWEKQLLLPFRLEAQNGNPGYFVKLRGTCSKKLAERYSPGRRFRREGFWSTKTRAHVGMLYLGAVCGIIAATRWAAAHGMPAPRVCAAMLLLLLPELVGARLLFVAFHLGSVPSPATKKPLNSNLSFPERKDK